MNTTNKSELTGRRYRMGRLVDDENDRFEEDKEKHLALQAWLKVRGRPVWLAERLNISYKTVENWSNGRSHPNAENDYDIKNALAEYASKSVEIDKKKIKEELEKRNLQNHQRKAKRIAAHELVKDAPKTPLQLWLDAQHGRSLWLSRKVGMSASDMCHLKKGTFRPSLEQWVAIQIAVPEIKATEHCTPQQKERLLAYIDMHFKQLFS